MEYVPPVGAPWAAPFRSERWERALWLVLDGSTVAAACRQVGVTPSAWSNLRAKSVEFKRRSDWVLSRSTGARSRISDFVDFRKTYFGYDTPPHQRVMVEAVQRAKDDSITLVLAPPEAGKTSLLTDLYCWLLAGDPNFRICVISEGQDLARKIVRHVARRMTDPSQFAAYIERYGPFKKASKSKHRASEDLESRQVWNADQLQVLGARNDQRDPSLEARGAGSRIYGSRYDLIVLDDICSTQNVNQSAQLLNYLRQDVLTRVSEDPQTHRRGKTVIVGTRVAKHDVYELMMEEEDFLDEIVEIPAVCEQRSYWPEKWPMDVLERRRKKVGEETWSRVYMQQPFSSKSATFTDEMIDACLDRDRVVGDRVGTNTILGVDPALVGWCAVTDVSYTSERFYLLDQEAERNLARTEEIITLVARHAGRYRPTQVIVERNAFQQGLSNDVRLAQVGKEYGFWVKAHKTDRNKQDPVLGVASMAGGFVRNEISIPWGDDISRRTFQPLIDELRAWRPDIPVRQLRQDRVMSMWFCWLDWLEIRQSLKRERVPQMWRPSWMAGARRGMW